MPFSPNSALSHHVGPELDPRLPPHLQRACPDHRIPRNRTLNGGSSWTESHPEVAPIPAPAVETTSNPFLPIPYTSPTQPSHFTCSTLTHLPPSPHEHISPPTPHHFNRAKQTFAAQAEQGCKNLFRLTADRAAELPSLSVNDGSHVPGIRAFLLSDADVRGMSDVGLPFVFRSAGVIVLVSPNDYGSRGPEHTQCFKDSDLNLLHYASTISPHLHPVHTSHIHRDRRSYFNMRLLHVITSSRNITATMRLLLDTALAHSTDRLRGVKGIYAYVEQHLPLAPSVKNATLDAIIDYIDEEDLLILDSSSSSSMVSSRASSPMSCTPPLLSRPILQPGMNVRPPTPATLVIGDNHEPTSTAPASESKDSSAPSLFQQLDHATSLEEREHLLQRLAHAVDNLQQLEKAQMDGSELDEMNKWHEVEREEDVPAPPPPTPEPASAPPESLPPPIIPSVSAYNAARALVKYYQRIDPTFESPDLSHLHNAPLRAPTPPLREVSVFHATIGPTDVDDLELEYASDSSSSPSSSSISSDSSMPSLESIPPTPSSTRMPAASIARPPTPYTASLFQPEHAWLPLNNNEFYNDVDADHSSCSEVDELDSIS